MKKILLMLALASLSACSGQVSQNVSQETSANKALVVMGLEMSRNRKVNPTLVWRGYNPDDGTAIKDRQKMVSKKVNGGQAALALLTLGATGTKKVFEHGKVFMVFDLEPGHWYLESIVTGTTTNNMTTHTVAVDVKAGETTYIGDMDFGNIASLMKGHSDEAMRAALAEYSGIGDEVRKIAPALVTVACKMKSSFWYSIYVCKNDSVKVSQLKPQSDVITTDPPVTDDGDTAAPTME